VYGDRYMKENCSDDLECDVIRIFDVNPTKEWPLKTNNVVLGGYPLMRMPYVVDDMNRPYLKDGESPITWFITYGSVREQKNILEYEVLPYLMMTGSTGGEILWSPCPEDATEADFRQDCLEVLDGFEKMEEFNVRYQMSFRMGIAKMWLPRGQDYERTRVYLCRLNAGLDMIGYYYAQCRVLTLGNFTTSDGHNKMGVAVDVENHNDRVFISEEYLEKDGYKLVDYCLRTIRQRIRKLFATEGVEPVNWSKDKSKGMIKAPGFKNGARYRFYDAPQGAPFKDLIKERATIRTEFSRNRSARKNLPVLGAIKFGMMNFMLNNVRQLDMSRAAKVLTGNGVKESLLPQGYKSLPDVAMIRFDQERGEQLDKEKVRIPKAAEV